MAGAGMMDLSTNLLALSLFDESVFASTVGDVYSRSHWSLGEN